MFGTLKHKVLSWSVIISLATIVSSCNTSNSIQEVEQVTKITGETQGTTYSVIVVGENVKLSKKELDRELRKFDLSLSTYIQESVISKINESKSFIEIEDPSGYFQTCYAESQVIYQKTNGLFDPSVFPLVKGWGFMNNMETPLDQDQIDSILKFVSFEEGKLHRVELNKNQLRVTKINENFKIDFNAIAQGLSVDVLYDYIEKKGYKNFYVEIGGELKVKGYNNHGTSWNIGVDLPLENLTERKRDTIIHISDKAIATSGNYRKFYVKDGVKYSHTLNPMTGKPVMHTLLSATVITDKCSTADGYATAFMVMGVEKTLEFVKNHPEEHLDVYLLYANSEGNIQRTMSSGFSKYLQKVFRK